MLDQTSENFANENQLPIFDTAAFDPLLRPSNVASTAYKADLIAAASDTLGEIERFSLTTAAESIDDPATLQFTAIDSPLDDSDFNNVDQAVDELLFNAGVFTVGSTGAVEIDYLLDGGGFQGELAIFSLEGLEQFASDSTNIIQEIVQRALSNSTLGHIVISDLDEGARFGGRFAWEENFNNGDYLGVKTFTMRPGDRFGVMLTPNGSIRELVDNPLLSESNRPLFSLSAINPIAGFHFGQIADVDGNGSTFVMEDLRLDQSSDRDYNDIVFQVRGATGSAAMLDDVISPEKDWRENDLGQSLLEYAAAYDNFITIEPDDFGFPQVSQPLIGVIDTGFAANNPDIDYSRITLGRDYVDGDANPLLSAEEGNEHGTHILGIIGATQNNDVGIDGINDKAPIWLGRAIGSGRWAESLVEFVNQALESNQSNAVVNLSLDLTQRNADGSITTRYEFTPEERAALEYARQSGVLIVVAAGNDGGIMSALGQASQEFDNIITVGAANGQERAEYSSFGYGLDLLAPGGTTESGILSTVGDGIGTLAGTSVATAHVTGAISQVWAANPDLSYRQVIEILKFTATDVDEPNWDAQTGAGITNLRAAVNLAKATEPVEHDAPASLVPETWAGEGSVIPTERAVGPFNYPIRTESFSGTVGPSVGVNLRFSPWFGDRSSRNEPRGKRLQFDAWTYGERGTDIWLNKPDELWYRVAGTNFWVPSAYISGYPGSRPSVLAPNQTQPNPNPSPSPSPSPNPNSQPNPFIPINSNSPNYRSGARNPFAYNPGLIGQCTWYAYGRMQETGLMPSGATSGALFRGHAFKWASDAKRLGLPVTSTPKVGARGLVVWPPGVRGGHKSFGHVAFLEEVYPDGRIRISESNWAGKGVSERVLSPSQYGGLEFVELGSARAGSVPAAAIPGRNQQYVIKRGDTLPSIAQRYLGNPNRWREITKTITGGTFTNVEARNLQLGSAVYLPIVRQVPSNAPSQTQPKPQPKPQLEQAKNGWGYVTRPGDNNRVGLDRVDGSMSDIQNRPTWIVIHGMNSDPSANNIKNLASTVGSYRTDDQVFTLDWRTAAYSGYTSPSREPVPDPNRGGSWITQVAAFAGRKLNEWKIDISNINVIGHSLGSYVAYEVAKFFGKQGNNVGRTGDINRLIALDPAVTTRGGYKDENNVDFSNYSSWAWGFYGSSLGNDDRAQTAEESFKFDFGGINSGKHHGAVVEAFTEMLEKNKDKQAGNISKLFDLNQMTNSNGKPWQRHEGGRLGEKHEGFEAVLKPKEEGGEWKPNSISYHAGRNQDTWWDPWDEVWVDRKE